MRIELTTTGDKQITTKLLAGARRALNLDPALRDTADELRRAADREFRAQRWLPLRPNTVRRKREEGLDPRILIATGAMRESLTTRHGGNIERVSGNQLDFGSSVYYLEFTQRRRPVLREVNRYERERIGRIFERFLTRGFGLK